MIIRTQCIPVRITESIPQPEPRPVEDLTPGVVKMFYEANPNTNPFTNADKAKLDDTYIFTKTEKIKLLSMNVFTDAEKDKLLNCNCNGTGATVPGVPPVTGVALTAVEQTVMDNLVATGTPRNTYSKTEVDNLLANVAFNEIGGLVWKGGEKYKVGTVVIQSNVPYKCVVSHTSVSWASDITNWEFIISDPGKF